MARIAGSSGYGASSTVHAAGRVQLRGPLGFTAVAAFHAVLIALVAGGMQLRVGLPSEPFRARFIDAPRPTRIPVEPIQPSFQASGPVETIEPELPLPLELPPGESAPTVTSLEPLAGAGASLPEVTYHAPRVDPRHPLTQPPYPAIAQRLGDEGGVELELRVAADGRVLEARVLSGSGSAYLDAAAQTEALRRWRFQPAQRGTEPVEAWHRVRVTFRLRDR